MEGIWRGDRDKRRETDESEQCVSPDADEEAWWEAVLEGDAADSEPDPDWDEPEKPYRGGRCRDLPNERGREKHHLIAAQSLKAAGWDPADGLAVVMDDADHRKTASWGPKARAKAFRAEQTRLLRAGREDEALAIGILDLQVKFGAKYRSATEEAIDEAER